ncbi:MAG: hypothetical protein COA57_10495 [Flavobacteriales bacterium]|nr:MAG: hypothetical protein COA57_10495 [Flavobacteriales bacterium]
MTGNNRKIILIIEMTRFFVLISFYFLLDLANAQTDSLTVDSVMQDSIRKAQLRQSMLLRQKRKKGYVMKLEEKAGTKATAAEIEKNKKELEKIAPKELNYLRSEYQNMIEEVELKSREALKAKKEIDRLVDD